MIGFLEGLLVTLKSAKRKPITAQYPEPEKRLKIQDRFMGFPALMWDGEVSEPYCTGCMVCIRNCPTQCMTAKMKDNPLAAEGKSSRRKIIEEFEINLGRCILCAICVDVCNFDAIEMSHEHELSKYQRNGNRADLPRLLELGNEFQAEMQWSPKQPEKNSGVPKDRTPDTDSPAVATAEAPARADVTKEERLAASRARSAAKRAGDSEEATTAEAENPAKPKSGMSQEERLSASRARAAAKKSGAAQAEGPTADANPTDVEPKSETSSQQRLAAARARARAKREAAGGSDSTSVQTGDDEESPAE